MLRRKFLAVAIASGLYLALSYAGWLGLIRFEWHICVLAFLSALFAFVLLARNFGRLKVSGVVASVIAMLWLSWCIFVSFMVLTIYQFRWA